jgi:hypothetical protein
MTTEMPFHSREPIRSRTIGKPFTLQVWCFHVALTDQGGLPCKAILHIGPARYCPIRFRIRAGQVMVSGSVTKI